jgi:hypothetical protein
MFLRTACNLFAPYLHFLNSVAEADISGSESGRLVHPLLRDLQQRFNELIISPWVTAPQTREHSKQTPAQTALNQQFASAFITKSNGDFFTTPLISVSKRRRIQAPGLS